jgi:FixJ family two-component response regulator
MSGAAPVVFLLDDEPGVVVALGRILRANGFSIRTWTSATEFLDAHDAETPGCLITDLRMPGMSGLEVQRVLLARGSDRPVIFITGEGDVRTTVLGMKAGAVTFLTKPIQPTELIGAVIEAITKDATRRAHRREQERVSMRIAGLTPRELQVLRLLTTGMLNKQIAAELGTTEKTVKTHRKRVLVKMGVRSATALVNLLYRGKAQANVLSQSLDVRDKAAALSRIGPSIQGRTAYV